MTGDGKCLFGRTPTEIWKVDLGRLRKVRLEPPEGVEVCGDEAEDVLEFVEKAALDEAPFDLVIIGPELFLPQMEIVNPTGQEYFEQLLVEDERVAQ
jgi:hypothetical protein